MFTEICKLKLHGNPLRNSLTFHEIIYCTGKRSETKISRYFFFHENREKKVPMHVLETPGVHKLPGIEKLALKKDNLSGGAGEKEAVGLLKN